MFKATFDLPSHLRHACGAEYDNAFNRVKDKSHIQDYLRYMRDREIVENIPLTMILLGSCKS